MRNCAIPNLCSKSKYVFCFEDLIYSLVNTFDSNATVGLNWSENSDCVFNASPYTVVLQATSISVEGVGDHFYLGSIANA